MGMSQQLMMEQTTLYQMMKEMAMVKEMEMEIEMEMGIEMEMEMGIEMVMVIEIEMDDGFCNALTGQQSLILLSLATMETVPRSQRTQTRWPNDGEYPSLDEPPLQKSQHNHGISISVPNTITITNAVTITNTVTITITNTVTIAHHLYYRT